MSSRIEVPRPRAINRAKVSYFSAPSTVAVPRPAAIDRDMVTYLSRAKIEVPLPAVIDREKVTYLSPVKIDLPQLTIIDRKKVTYLATAKIAIPQPAVIDRAKLTYLSPTPERKLDAKTPVIEPKTAPLVGGQMSVLEKNIHSPVTPGSKNFALFAISPDLLKKADERLAQYPADQKRSAVLPLLHEVQHRFGFISPEAIEWVAEKLEIEPIKVVEVVTFYPGFRQKAPGKFHVRVCRTLSCAMGGSGELMEKLCELTGIDRSKNDPHSDPIAVSPCGNYSVEFAECLAACGTAPVCLVNDDFHEGITADKAQDFLNSFQKA